MKREKLYDILEYLKKSFEFVDILHLSKKGVELEVRNSGIDTLKFNDSGTVLIRVIDDFREASFVVNNPDLVDKDFLKRLESYLKTAISYKAKDKNITIPLRLDVAGNTFQKFGKENYPDIQQIASEMIEVEKFVLSYDKRIKVCEVVGFQSDFTTTFLINSAGFSGEFSNHTFSKVVSVVGEENGIKENGWYYEVVNDYSRFKPFLKMGEEACKRTVSALNKGEVKKGLYPVFFNSYASHSFFRSIMGAFSGKSAVEHTTFLEKRLGQKVASDVLSIKDHKLYEFGNNPLPFDHEGSPGKNTYIVEKGVLKTFLTNLYTASKLGIDNTGNASRSGGTTGVKPSNFIIEKGRKTEEEIVQSISRGIYVTELLGFGINVINGNLSQGISGYYIENGKKLFALKEVTVSGTLQKLLSSVIELSNEHFYGPSVIAPGFLVSELMVSN